MKNILLGFLMATCMFLMIGAISSNDLIMLNNNLMQIDGKLNKLDNGRYQGFSPTDGVSYMIDTRTGELYSLHISGKNKSKWVRKSPKTDWIKE